MKHLVFLMVAIAACAALAKTSTPEGWTDDYDAALRWAKAQYDLEASKRKTKDAADEEDEKPPTDGRWHGLDWADVWAEGVRTNAALPTAWKYFTEQFRPYVKRYLGVPATGPFAAELDSLADATALAIWHNEPMVSVHDTYGLHGVMLSADALCARGCTNRLARAFAAAVRYHDKLVRENRMLAEDPLARDCESLAKELVSSPEMPVAARIFSIYYGRGGCREFSEQTMVESLRSRPNELRPFFHVFGVPPAARKDGVDPWLRLVADAWGEHAAAWSARGSGLAYTVGEKQWKEFGEHLDKAEGYMAEAWRLHPEIPDTAAMMLKIVAPQCSKAQLNRWFAEVLDREVDNPFAWSTFFSIPCLVGEDLSRRCGGSRMCSGVRSVLTRRSHITAPLGLTGSSRSTRSPGARTSRIGKSRNCASAI